MNLPSNTSRIPAKATNFNLKYLLHLEDFGLEFSGGDSMVAECQIWR